MEDTTHPIDDYNINDYSKYYETNNGSPTDPNTYIINMIGYYYTYDKININQTLYNKSLELIKTLKRLEIQLNFLMN